MSQAVGMQADARVETGDSAPATQGGKRAAPSYSPGARAAPLAPATGLWSSPRDGGAGARSDELASVLARCVQERAARVARPVLQRVILPPPQAAVPIPAQPAAHTPPSATLLVHATAVRGATQATTPRTACEFTLAGGQVFRGQSGAGHVLPAALVPYFDVNQPGNPHHPGCAESDCLIQAVNAHGLAAVDGGTWDTVRVRPLNSQAPPGQGHGTHLCPCDGCRQVASLLGINYT